MARFNLAGLAAEFRDLAHAMPEHKHEALGKVAEFVEADAQARFGTYQKGWPELADATQADRVQQGYPADAPLLRSGSLKDSYAHVVGDETANVGSNDPRAVWIETGTTKTPPRPEIARAAGDAVFGKMGFTRRA